MSEIPNAFGGFAPFPNTIMIPTMGLQSAVIGYRFGFGYEKGKRTLRAMSNEQFNNLDEEAEQAIFKRHDSAAINYFKTEMHNWVELQNLIIEKSVEIEVMKANRTPSALREIFEGFTAGFSTQQVDDAKKFFASITDPIMKLMAFFSGHKATNAPSQQPSFTPPATNAPSQQPSFTPPTITVPSQGINPNITQTDVSIKGLPTAGQTQIMERDKLIQDINNIAKGLKTFGLSLNKKNQLTGLLKSLQNQLITLLGKYNW